MPVYEYYCVDCHTIFNFLSRRININKRPNCPKCGRPELAKQVSLFAHYKGRGEEEPNAGMPGFDEEKIARAVTAMEGEVDGIDENDPRQIVRMMRKLSEAAGVKLGPHVEEAMHRLESGEEPDRVEEEMGDLLEQEPPFSKEVARGIRRRLSPPAHDDTLYSLEF